MLTPSSGNSTVPTSTGRRLIASREKFFQIIAGQPRLAAHAVCTGAVCPSSTSARATTIRQLVLLGLLFCIALLGMTQTGFAAGNEVMNREDDLVLIVDSRWPGNAYGGYFPLRIRLSNLGPPRDLVFRYEGRDPGATNRIPDVRRAVRAEQQATINFTLSIPMVSQGTEGVLRVYDASGEEYKTLSSRHSLPDYGGFQPRTSLLVISTAAMDDKVLQPFEDAAATEYAFLSGIASGGGGITYSSRHYPSQVAERDHAVVAPASGLPVNWLDYSGLDLVAVAWTDWNGKLSASEREAILKWTSAGGVLVIYETLKPAARLVELSQSLKLDHGTAGWGDCLPDDYRATTITKAEALRIAGGNTPASGTVTTTEGDEEAKGEVDIAADHWIIGKDTYSQRDWMLGKIYVFKENPFPGTASDWAWWLSSLPKDQSHWPRKFGMSSRTVNNEFLNFLIPGVGSVPVFAFLTLITLFTIVIGPLNYYWLHKRRRLAAMVFTVPLIAGVTSLLLFGYSLISDGFSIRSRVNSFTWLDQEHKSAVSLSRICLYAPFAPSSGLTFSPECAVFPIWRTSTNFDSGNLDWSGNDQRFNSGWFRSQTWTQFQTVECRDERGRLDFTPPSDPDAESITVSNGLAWDLEYLVIKGTGPNWYGGENVPAGATAQLKRQSLQEVSAFFDQAQGGKRWNFPEGLKDPASTIAYPTYGRYRQELPLQTSFAQSLLKRNLPTMPDLGTLPRSGYFDWRDARNIQRNEPHSAATKPRYWAITRTNPGIQVGTKSHQDQTSQHVLFGTF